MKEDVTKKSTEQLYGNKSRMTENLSNPLNKLNIHSKQIENNMTPPKPSKTALCSCQQSCCPITNQENNIKCLLRICHTEWVIMGILVIMILTRLIINLEEDDWVWFMVYIIIK